MRVEPLTPTIGAEVFEVDLRHPLDDTTVRTIRTALLEHLVLFFRDQDISDERQLAFARCFGDVKPSVFQSASSTIPGVAVLDTDAPRGTTDRWHADESFLAEPPLGAVLRSVHLPREGGDTCFASMYAAYDRLSSPLRRMLDDLSAQHSVAENLQRVIDHGNITMAEIEPTTLTNSHPVVRVHPETGRRLLNVNSGKTTRILELERAESDAVLSFLFEHIQSPEFQCRFRWTPDSIAFWDNRAVQHYALPDYAERRVMHRVQIAGDRPYGPTGGR